MADHKYFDAFLRLRAPVVRDPFTRAEVPDWSGTLATRVVRGAVQPAGRSTELTDHIDVVITNWSVTCEVADIVASDRVRWRGSDYEVDGDVATLLRRGEAHHMEFALSLVKEAGA